MFDFCDEGSAFFEFVGVIECFFWGKDVGGSGVAFGFFEEEQKSFVFVVEMLYFYFHLVDFGGFNIFFEGLDDVFLAVYFVLQLLDDLL